MNTKPVLELILTPAAPVSSDDLSAFLRSEDGEESYSVALSADIELYLGMLLNLARRAGTRRQAAAAGLQCAIRRLFGRLESGTIAAFSISEDKGPHPRGINTSITPTSNGGFVLNGTKRYASYAPLADLILVCGSLGETDGRKQLRMVEVAADAAGLSIDPAPYLERFPGHPIADLTLTDVAVGADAVLEEDAYTTYIKPFRLIEDTLIALAMQIALAAALARCSWQADNAPLVERLAGLITQGLHVGGGDFAEPAALVLIGDYLHQSDRHWQTLSETWPQLLDAEAWGRSDAFLPVGAAAREKRFSEALGALATLD